MSGGVTRSSAATAIRGLGRITVGWMPCDCPPALAGGKGGYGHPARELPHGWLRVVWYKPQPGPVQLSQAWSFQGALVDTVSEQVKAWGYAISRLRDGEAARVTDVSNWNRRVDSAVDLQVVATPATSPEQQDVYGEAQQVFRQLDASVHDLQHVEAVGLRAGELMGIGSDGTHG